MKVLVVDAIAGTLASQVPAPDTKGARTRRSLVTAAIERFARDGFRATSVADIARDAGLSPTAAYAYFANKEALFLEAVDADTTALLAAGAASFADMGIRDTWELSLMTQLLGELEFHPLAGRLLGGLEPEVTHRVLRIPALDALRDQLAKRIAHLQSAGLVRRDIDPDQMAGGGVAILLAMLMAVVQVGPEAMLAYQEPVVAFFEAAFSAPA